MATSRQDPVSLKDDTKVNEDQDNSEKPLEYDKRKPGKPMADKIKADSIELSWREPDAFISGCTYQVRFKDLDAKSKWKIFQNEYTSSTVTLTDLKASTNYIFQVRMIDNDEEEGPYSEASNVSTDVSPAEKPLEYDKRKPGKPMADKIKADSIELSWREPDAFISGCTYQVRFKDLDAKSKWKIFQNEYTSSTVTLTDLKASTNYIFQVRMIDNDEEEGPYSEASSNVSTDVSPAEKPLEYDKRKPGKPMADKIKADSIELSWRKPDAFISGCTYHVRFKDLDAKSKWKIFQNEYTSSTVNLTELKASTNYMFQVRMIDNDEEEGPYSEASSNVSTDVSPAEKPLEYDKRKPGKPMADKIKADSIELSWRKPDAFISGCTYQVRFKDIDAKSKWKIFQNEYTSSTVTLTDLKASSNYMFQVRMIDNDEEEGPYSEASSNVSTDVSPAEKPLEYDKRKPGKPMADKIKADSIELSWRKPDAFISGCTYQVRFKDIDAKSKWKIFQNEYTSSTVTLTDLKASSNYMFQVRMIDNDEEEGPYSEASSNVSTDVSPAEKPLEYDKRKPGKPMADKIKADSIELSWRKPEAFISGCTYQVRFKDLDAKSKWKIFQNEYTSSTVTLTNLKASTNYMFQVRMVDNDKEEGPYSEASSEVSTDVSPGIRLQKIAKLVEEGTPSKYALPLTELENARCVKAKSRKFELGSPPQIRLQEKTIMLVGATGTGKSTLVNGLVNYILGVNWNDSFRFTVVNLEEEEKMRTNNQALSQTEWITCYSINPEKGYRLDYRLNIIDTPGFGDTRGLERDNQIVDQIRELFSAKNEKGVAVVDAVCFLIKAPDARFTAIQKYIYHQMMSLFGQDIEQNICSLITFADEQNPPVIASLTESKLPFGRYFTFNNSGLFATNSQSHSFLSPMFWDMGVSSYQAFFDTLSHMKTKSLILTQQVLDERKKLELTIAALQPQVDAGLSTIDSLERELKIYEQHESDIKDNKDFEYEVSETKILKKDLPKGVHVTNCIHCHITCHANCAIADDERKKNCSAMDSNGNCKICSSKCHWKLHKNMPFLFEYSTEQIKKTYQGKLKKYQEATGQLLTAEQVLEKMYEQFKELDEGIISLMTEVYESNNRLKEIALRPNPLNMVEHLDLMIEAEQMEKKAAFKNV